MQEEKNESHIAAIRAWLRHCPHIDYAARFGVDYLSDGTNQYAVYSSPSTIAYHENVLGENIMNDIQTENFIFASKGSYGKDIRDNIDNVCLFDAVCSWMNEQNNKRILPDIKDGKSLSVLPTLSVYPAEVGSGIAKYQIQLQFKYRRF